MEFDQFGEAHGHHFCHENSITKISADVPRSPFEYFLGLDSVKESIQS